QVSFLFSNLHKALPMAGKSPFKKKQGGERGGPRPVQAKRLPESEALAIDALAQFDAPRTVGVGDQTLLVCIYRDREALDVLFLEAVLMQRLEREDLLEGYIQGAQGVVLGAAQATSYEFLELAQLAVRLVLVIQLEDLA